MIEIVWVFRARPGNESAFEAAYGPDGDWARLFEKGAGYLGTTLARDREQTGRYLCIDRWRSLPDFESFKGAHAAEYETLDRRCEALTAEETKLGVFSMVE